MHDKHVIHRDIKLDNILCDHFGNVKIADFDIAVMLTQKNRERVTNRFGAKEYRPLEVLKQQPYDKPVDIWHLGCLLIELACCDIPWSGMNHHLIKPYLEKKPIKPI